MKPAEYYTYLVPFLNLAVQPGNGQQLITFDASSDFIWMYSTYVAYNHAAITNQTVSNAYVPPITLLMTPGDTSAQMMNAPVPIGCLFGVGGGELFVLPTPRTLPSRSTMLLQVTSLDTTIVYDLYLSMIGIKRFLA
jgi:hypothetical protein